MKKNCNEFDFFSFECIRSSLEAINKDLINEER